MSMNSTPSSERIHIGIFGRRNAGKSSLINALTGQRLAIVSDVKGTTTDPVLKAMELLPLGPVVMIDTPGLDDEGELGTLRIQKAGQMLNKTDIALLVIDASLGMTEPDASILAKIQDKNIPYMVILNKLDLIPDHNKQDRIRADIAETCHIDKNLLLWVSTFDGTNIHKLKEQTARLIPDDGPRQPLVRDLIHPGDFVVLVIPIDKAAPKGRLILPQQQTIRDILEAGAIPIAVRNTELRDTLKHLGKKPSLVITDSQVFEQTAEAVPDDIPLTSFSILFARYKGSLETVVLGAESLETLKDGDTLLISEGCTHHRQCEDIGTVKLPGWIRNYTGKTLNFEFTSGTEFPFDLSHFKLIIHCGGCTLNEREMKYRLRCARDAGIPITNYGTAIAHMKGILKRSTAVFQKK